MQGDAVSCLFLTTDFSFKLFFCAFYFSLFSTADPSAGLCAALAGCFPGVPLQLAHTHTEGVSGELHQSPL